MVPSEAPPRVLILTCGNPSRGDDALGPALHRRLEGREQRPADPARLTLVTDFQFQIEHALDLVDQDLVLFADASASGPAPFAFSILRPVPDDRLSSHALHPGAVLQVHRQALGREPPPAFLLAIRGERFELGAPLSPSARQNLDAAVALVLTLLSAPDPGLWTRWTDPAEPGARPGAKKSPAGSRAEGVS